MSGSETLTPGYVHLRSTNDMSIRDALWECDILTWYRTNGATFDWRGKGWLFFVSSHWEVLGYGKDVSSNLEWAVTCTSFPLKLWITQEHGTEMSDSLLKNVIHACWDRYLHPLNT